MSPSSPESVRRVCAPSPAATFDFQAACQGATQTDLSPIDEYYAAAESITILGEPGRLAASAELGRLLLLGHVGAVETYVRSTLVRLLSVCDAARVHAGVQQLSLSSLYYYRPDEVPLGLFDRASLAGADEIKKAVRRVTNYDIPDSSALGTTLRKFDGLCHLRHAAVHAHGTISSAGAYAIGLGGHNQRLRVVIDFARAQEAALICRATVQDLNQFLFSETASLWKRTGRLTGDFTQDASRFRALLRVFWSRQDASVQYLPAKAVHDELFTHS